MTHTAGADRAQGAAVWAAGFRPFFLAAAFYGPALLGWWYGARLGWWPSPDPHLPLWALHAHEMLFGFAGALVCGILLTAMPSWTGAAEIRGAPLQLLAALWLIGRGCFLFQHDLPAPLVVVGDGALLPVLGLLLAYSTRGARKRLFAWTTVPLCAFAAANFLFYAGVRSGSTGEIERALALAVDALMFLFTLYGGLFVPAFTRRWLRARGIESKPLSPPIEMATAAAMLAFALADLLHAPVQWMTLTASAAALIHAWRWARWRGWRAFRDPILRCVHLGYLWLIASFLLRACAGTRLAWQDAAIHAFTIGAYSTLKLGLMTRVALKHTGRAVRADRMMRFAYALLPIAAILRVAFALSHGPEWLVGAAAFLWALAFLIYGVRFAPLLVRASLPRRRAAPHPA
ncbi:MAG: NnrS family protein [Gammaproteobacteria bacterium]|nr:NnrS family protein [Gammaproteobacteria bacterium]